MSFKEYIKEIEGSNYFGKDPKTKADMWEIDRNEKGNKIIKYVILPKDKLDIGMTIYKVFDYLGHVIRDDKTMIPRWYFTNLSDAKEAMDSNKKGEKEQTNNTWSI